MLPPKFDYGDLVSVKATVKFWVDVPGRLTTGPRVGEPASIYSVTTDRGRHARPEFPEGGIYGIEFDGGDAIEVHEEDLELIRRHRT